MRRRPSQPWGRVLIWLVLIAGVVLWIARARQAEREAQPHADRLVEDLAEPIRR